MGRERPTNWGGESSSSCLAGLTCTDENFLHKANALPEAARLGIALVFPDTSPRGIPGAGDMENVGDGAGFYVNATNEPWSHHFRMYDYVLNELRQQLGLDEFFNSRLDFTREGLMGHSMGGHGALILALKNPKRFKSVSAFAPICHPTEAEWGHRAFLHYFGPRSDEWMKWDATALVATQDHTSKQERKDMLLKIDIGSDDPFLNQLMHEPFLEKATTAGIKVDCNLRPGYDHGYFFIQSFIRDHFDHHAHYLRR